MSIGDLELLDIDRLWVSEVNVVKKGRGPPEVHFVLAHSGVMLENQVHVPFAEVLRSMFEVEAFPDVIFLAGGQRLAEPFPGPPRCWQRR